MLKYLSVFMVLTTASVAAENGASVARLATDDEVAAWDIDVRPDGIGLPVGQGSVVFGEGVFDEKCAACHGGFGEGVGRNPPLAGGRGTLEEARPTKTIGSYWPYVSTVWDYVHRAMPYGDAQSLTDDEVYGVVAYLLFLNDLVGGDFVLDHENLAGVTLPNETAFYMDDRAVRELPLFSRTPCMQGCKTHVVITRHVTGADVTPQ